MSRRWAIERGDDGGVFVFEVEGPVDEFAVVLDTELEAVEYGIDCAEGWRTGIADSIRHLKRRRRQIMRRKTKPQG